MPLDRVGAEGANQLRALAHDCKEAGEKLPREFYAAIGHATKPAVAAVYASFMETLPKGNGVNAFISDSTKVKRSLRTTGRTAGVRIVAVGQHDIRALNRGVLRAPTFGHRGKGYWHNQPITPGMFDRPLEELTPEVRAELFAVMGRIQRELAGR